MADELVFSTLTTGARGSAAAERPATDPITAEIIGSAFSRIVEEMLITMLRTSRSPITNEGHDYSVAIFDPSGRMVAHGMGVPVLMGATRFSVRAILQSMGNDLHEGDVIINNDPYSGGSHCGDLTLAMPIFDRGTLVAIPVIRAHMVDAGGGGAVSGGFYPDARLTLEESHIIPPLKLYERGRLRTDVHEWLLSNNRIPHWFGGDLDGMYGSCEVARKRIQDLLDRYGHPAMVDAMEYAIRYSEQRVRKEIAQWPDGEYEGCGYVDGDLAGTFDMRVKCKVKIGGDRLLIDFTGTDPQVPGPANSPIANTITWVYIALSTCLPPDIPKIEGVWNCIEVIVPEGTLINPYEGAPCGMCTVNPGQEVSEAVINALAQAIPDKVAENLWKLAVPTFFGTDPRTGRPYGSSPFHILAGGAGATKGEDGWAGVWFMGGQMFSGPEMAEVQLPHRIEEKEFVIDTAGPGQWRGGPTVRYFLRVLDHTWGVSALVWGVRHPAGGLCDGGPGQPNRLVLGWGGDETVDVPGGTGHVGFFAPNTGVLLERGSGGGWGSPLLRDPEKVLQDVLDEYISIEGARRDYGVVIDPKTLRVDTAATAQLRRQLQQERNSGQ